MNDIVGELEAVLRAGYSSYAVFDDWLDLMLYALMGEEEKYLEVVRRYPNTAELGNREIDYFANAFGLLMKTMKQTNDEILGELYMLWNMANKYKGQFFTPKHIASLMAQLLKPHGRIIDPCCGSGIMLVEAIKTMKHEELKQSVFYGQDIDLTCVKMCALNLTFFNVSGFVIWGDTLRMEVKRVYETSRSSLGGCIRELTDNETIVFARKYRASLITSGIIQKVYHPATHDTEQPVSESAINQLHLF